ncbi:MAG: ABC transporter substrate-binding protein [Chloroflexota bacterium]|nr:ABC transporter substrate-binding protein [Chloroflexota bacterium]
MITRRQFTIGVGAAALAVPLRVPRLSAAGQLVFTSWGGTTQEAQEASWAVPFAEKTGITVVQDGPTDYGKLKAMVESGNVTWNVVDVEFDFSAQAAKEGLLEPIDFSVVNRDQLEPRFTTDHAVGSFYYSFVLGYNPGTVGAEGSKTWADVFDTATYPGKRTFYKWAAPGVLEIALLADGVKPQELYPLDVDRAYKKLDTVKGDIVWWGSGAESQQLLASGEVGLGQFWNGRLFALQQEGADVGISWDQNLTAADALVVPKGSPNKEAAMQFLAYATSAEAQAAFAKASGYAPINLGSKALLDEATVQMLPESHTESQVNLDMQYWADNRDELGTRWYEWQAK